MHWNMHYHDENWALAMGHCVFDQDRDVDHRYRMAKNRLLKFCLCARY